MNSLPLQLVSNLSLPRTNLTDRLQHLHQIIASRYPFVHRLAMALYDPRTDMLKTFISSNTDGQRLVGYEARLQDVPSLKKLADGHSSRVVNEIDEVFNRPTGHTSWLKENNYQSSYTLPVFQGNHLAGFMFFDSKESYVFLPEVTEFLDVFADLTAQLYLLELRAVRGLIGTVQVASGLARIRDLETGNHLERIANYSRLIARGVMATYQLDDEFIEYLHLFAPLHDIGKVGIPDDILLKPGHLDEAEWVVMRQHVEIGETLIKQIIEDLGMEEGLATAIMYNVVAYHHERGDGSGYPRGLTGKDIPIEARIVAVADVYDALAHRRPYKHPWTEAEIARELHDQVAIGHLDGPCVDALLAKPLEIQRIKDAFPD
ncbi:HD-GYP domain-containing protein [Leeia oryzae]|uniref:HD-GYP domain-containing protein n=1 Tax=Leeia oryzae TaxID=356662 RepID=UPI001B7F95D2|nr:HD domain-containing phosphohydrolase [Leeia oryzae]